MKRKIYITVIKLIILLIFFSHCTLYSQKDFLIEGVKIPSEWIIKKSVTGSREQLNILSVRLGFEMVRVVNYLVDAEGVGLQIKVVECKTEEDAKSLYQLVSSNQKANANRFLQKGKIFFEFASNSSEMIKTAKSVFKQDEPINFEADKTIIWEVNLSVAPIQKGNYMAFNDLFSLLIHFDKSDENRKIESDIKRLSGQFQFTETISLRNENPPWGAPEYHISSARVVKKEGDVIIYRILEPKYNLGIPCFSIQTKIPVKPFESYKPDTPVNIRNLTAENKHWPKSDEKIVNIIKKIIKNRMTSEQKVDSIQKWVLKNIKYGGEKIGTRYGVKQVLKQGFGRCWDFCDVFVTLGRAAGIPCRQIMGWIYKKAGHTWVQVYISKKGWVSLDPTTPFKGVSGDYIPLFVSEDGKLPAVFWKKPIIKKISTSYPNSTSVSNKECVLDRKVSIIDSLILDIPDIPPLCDCFKGEKKKIDIGSCELYVETEGVGTPLVLLHGGPGSTHHEFHPYFSRAVDFAQVIYYDQRGCGFSDYEKNGGYSLAQAVEDLEKLRNRLHIERWVILGHSYGGLLAQCYAVKYPEPVIGLVLVSAKPGMNTGLGESRQGEFISEQESQKIFQLKMKYFSGQISMQQLIYNAFLNGDWKRQHFYKPSREEIARAALYNWMHDEGFNDIMNRSAGDIDLTGAFENCPIPTLIIEGKWDLTWGNEKAKIFSNNHSNARLVMFEHSGHSPFRDEPDKFFQTLKEFIINLDEIDKDKIIHWKNIQKKQYILEFEGK